MLRTVREIEAIFLKALNNVFDRITFIFDKAIASVEGYLMVIN